MNPLQLMEMHRSDFTPNDLVIYQAILDKKPDEAAAASERHIAAWFHSLKENWEEKNE